jgi:hypothetical protein
LLIFALPLMLLLNAAAHHNMVIFKNQSVWLKISKGLGFLLNDQCRTSAAPSCARAPQSSL